MSVTSLDHDHESLTLTLVADYNAPVDRVWEMWSVPHLLAQWWGPPTYPATVEQHEFEPGGVVKYFMTSPEGERHGGWWRVIKVAPPTGLEFVDGFSGPDGEPVAELPRMTVRVELSEQGNGTRMVINTKFDSAEDLDQMLQMGMEEGLEESVGQIDGLLEK